MFGDQSGFVDQLRDQAMKLNSFIHPLPPSEVRTIVKSVAKYTWEEHEVFKAKQSARGSRAMAKRWAGHVTAAERAAAAGVSRATLYRQEKKLREKNSKAQV